MKILSASQIRQADAYTIENEPIDSIDLMERASEQCVSWILEKFGENRNFKIFTGPGNNGGDGMAIARLLNVKDIPVNVYTITDTDKFSPDCLTNFKRLRRLGTVVIDYISNNNFPEIDPEDIVIDAIYGSGLSRAIEGIAANLINYINSAGATVIAVDIPSGLFCDDNTANKSNNIIRADYTLTFQLPKLSFLFAENEKYTGIWVILDILLLEESIENQSTQYIYTDIEYITRQLKKRPVFAHKGTFGHALLVSGGYGKTGAAILASKACLRSGAGLLTVHIPRCAFSVLQTAFPEAMVSVDTDEFEITTIPEIQKFSAIGIGPGIGTSANTQNALKIVLQQNLPTIIDADGINILSMNPGLMANLKANTILTPHPGEFDRITGKSETGFERHLKQIELSKKYQIVIVLKGAYTSITAPDGMCYFNSTGNSGMATAGSGDVLTGIILSLLAQGYLPLEAARIAVFIHGLAGDFAEQKFSQQSLIASDIINSLGAAFKQVQLTQ